MKKNRIIKSKFHGNRDFYSLIKGLAIEGSTLSSISEKKQIVPIINNIIERNFGGISYDIDIDFELIFDDIKDTIEKVKNEILKEKLDDNLTIKQKGKHKDEEKEDDIKDLNKKSEDNIIKVTSVYLLKKNM